MSKIPRKRNKAALDHKRRRPLNPVMMVLAEVPNDDIAPYYPREKKIRKRMNPIRARGEPLYGKGNVMNHSPLTKIDIENLTLKHDTITTVQ